MSGWTILRFLAATPGIGYRTGEIVEALDTPRGSVGTTLGRLHNQGSVRHGGEYWAINPDVYDVYAVSSIGLAAVNGQLEGDYYDENLDWDINPPDFDESEDVDFSTE